MKALNALIRWGLVLLILFGNLFSAVQTRADLPLLSATAVAQPDVLDPEEFVDYSVSVRYGGTVPLDDLAIAVTLPEGFSYRPGSARFWHYDTLVSTADPILSGGQHTWSGLPVSPARTASYFGMHTFVQDYCQTDQINYQLDRVRELMGPNAFVKQLFYNITPDTTGPAACWTTFVNAAYDRDLIPVLRLQGTRAGGNWVKPPADSPGNYASMAEAFRRVVAGLPKRQGKPLYIEVWNEPNLAHEWSGQVNATEYGHFMVDVAAALRSLNDPRIVIMNGGLCSWPFLSNSDGHLNAPAFIDQMMAVPGAIDSFDVWAVHPYPGNRPPEQNVHDGTATLYPEISIDGYLFELQRLATYGRTHVQVLLTETGYALGAMDFTGPLGLPAMNEANRADYVSRAFRDYWSQWPEVLGVCPYQLVDPSGDWTVWDWVYPSGACHEQYNAVQGLNKTPPMAEVELRLSFQAQASAQPGSYSSHIVVSSAHTGDQVLFDAAPVSVRGEIVPTPTLSPTPTATPVPTPTPPPNVVCSDILSNGGFEANWDWQIPMTVLPASYNDTRAYTGQRSMLTGQTGGTVGFTYYSSAQQAFHIPEDAVSADLSFWAYPLSDSTAHGNQYALLLNEAQQSVETVLWTASNARAWQQHSYGLGHRAGQWLWLRLGSRVIVPDGQQVGATAMYVDDVTLTVCRPTLLSTLDHSYYLAFNAGGRKAPAAMAESEPVQHETAAQPMGVTDQGMGYLMASDLVQWRPEGHLAFDAPRRRIITASDSMIQIRDATLGHVLLEQVVPGNVTDLAVSPDDGHLLVALDTGQVLLLSGDGRELARLSGLGRPANLIIHQERLYLSDLARQTVLIVRLPQMSIIEEKEYPALPHPLALDPDGGRLYVGQIGRDEILVLDALTLASGDSIPLPGVGLIQSLLWYGERLYTVHSLSARYGAVSLIDTNLLRRERTLWGNPQAPLEGITDLVLEPATGRLLVSTSTGIIALHPHTLAVTGKAAIADSRPGPLAVDPSTGQAYSVDLQGQIWHWPHIE